MFQNQKLYILKRDTPCFLNIFVKLQKRCILIQFWELFEAYRSVAEVKQSLVLLHILYWEPSYSIFLNYKEFSWEFHEYKIDLKCNNFDMFIYVFNKETSIYYATLSGGMDDLGGTVMVLLRWGRGEGSWNVT